MDTTQNRYVDVENLGCGYIMDKSSLRKLTNYINAFTNQMEL